MKNDTTETQSPPFVYVGTGIVHHMAALDGSPHPPNSIEAIQACVDYKASVIEVDITALASGDYLLVHDALLDAETTGSGAVGACQPAEAAGLRIRRRGAATDYAVPLLSQVVALLLANPSGPRLQLDFKNMEPFSDDAPLRTLVNLIEPLGDRVIVSTGADWQLRKMRGLAGWLNLGFDIHFYIDWDDGNPNRSAEAYPRALGAYGYWDDHALATRRIWSSADYLRDRCQAFVGLVPGANTFYIDHHFLQRSLDDGFNWADELHRHGIRLDAWTMDIGKPEAEKNLPLLARSGVDLITTNTPIAVSRAIQAG